MKAKLLQGRRGGLGVMVPKLRDVAVARILPFPTRLIRLRYCTGEVVELTGSGARARTKSAAAVSVLESMASPGRAKPPSGPASRSPRQVCFHRQIRPRERTPLACRLSYSQVEPARPLDSKSPFGSIHRDFTVSPTQGRDAARRSHSQQESRAYLGVA